MQILKFIFYRTTQLLKKPKDDSLKNDLSSCRKCLLVVLSDIAYVATT